MQNKIVMEIDEQKFTEHMRRIYRTNTRKPCKICLACPFREYVLEIMRKNGWKLPNGALGTVFHFFRKIGVGPVFRFYKLHRSDLCIFCWEVG